MLENAFIGRAEKPTDTDLSTALGRTKAVWDQLLLDLAREHGAETHEWKSYSARYGWSLRIVRKKRTIVWLSPGEGGFMVLFILGEKAVAAARSANLTEKVRLALEVAPKYPEGTGLRLLVKSARDLPPLSALAAIKVMH